MQASQTPTLVPLAFAANGTKNTIPEASQIGVIPGAASLNDGFPPLTMTPIAAGGVPPAGADFNGILNLITQTIRWVNAGGQFKYSSTFASDSNVGGYPAGAILLNAAGTGIWLNTVDGNTSNPDSGGTGWVGGFSAPLAVGPATASQHAVQMQQIQGTYASRNLTGANNSTTQFTVQADQAIVRNPATGLLTNVAATAGYVADITVAGPTAGGRDQSAAFSASSWIHLYWIYNGTALATIWSANAPATGPNLPTGYTSWGYIGTFRLNSSTQLVNCYLRGQSIKYQTLQNIVAAGTATTPTSVSAASFVPPNAVEYDLIIPVYGVTAAASSNYGTQVVIEVVSSIPFYQTGFGGTNSYAGATSISQSSGTIRLPNVNQTFYYANTSVTGTSPNCTISCNGYSVANGA